MSSDLLPFLAATQIRDKVVCDVTEENKNLRDAFMQQREQLHAGCAVLTGPDGSAIQWSDPTPPQIPTKANREEHRQEAVMRLPLRHVDVDPEDEGESTREGGRGDIQVELTTRTWMDLLDEDEDGPIEYFSLHPHARTRNELTSIELWVCGLHRRRVPMCQF